MRLVYEAVAEVVNFKSETEYTTTEEADAAEGEDIMAVVDAEAVMSEAVGIIQVTGREYQMPEWYSAMMEHI